MIFVSRLETRPFLAERGLLQFVLFFLLFLVQHVDSRQVCMCREISYASRAWHTRCCLGRSEGFLISSGRTVYIENFQLSLLITAL